MIGSVGGGSTSSVVFPVPKQYSRFEALHLSTVGAETWENWPPPCDGSPLRSVIGDGQNEVGVTWRAAGCGAAVRS